MNAADRDFLAGRDLAVSMLRHMQAEDDTGACSIEAQYRNGMPQNNAARSYLLQLVQRPELLDGFAAVISDGFGGGLAYADVYAELSLAEMRGPRGDASFRTIMARIEAQP